MFDILRENAILYNLEKQQTTACQFLLEYIFFSGKAALVGSADGQSQGEVGEIHPSDESEAVALWQNSAELDSQIAAVESERRGISEEAAKLATSRMMAPFTKESTGEVLLPPRILMHVLPDVKRSHISPRYAKYEDDL